jgi:hypothetical protein
MPLHYRTIQPSYLITPLFWGSLSVRCQKMGPELLFLLSPLGVIAFVMALCLCIKRAFRAYAVTTLLIASGTGMLLADFGSINNFVATFFLFFFLAAVPTGLFALGVKSAVTFGSDRL